MHVVDTFFLFSFFPFSPSRRATWSLAGADKLHKIFREKKQNNIIWTASDVVRIIKSFTSRWWTANAKKYTAMLLTHSRYFGSGKICINCRYWCARRARSSKQWPFCLFTTSAGVRLYALLLLATFYRNNEIAFGRSGQSLSLVTHMNREHCYCPFIVIVICHLRSNRSSEKTRY